MEEAGNEALAWPAAAVAQPYQSRLKTMAVHIRIPESLEPGKSLSLIQDHLLTQATDQPQICINNAAMRADSGLVQLQPSPAPDPTAAAAQGQAADAEPGQQPEANTALDTCSATALHQLLEQLPDELAPIDWVHWLYLQPPADAEVVVQACGRTFVTCWDRDNQHWLTQELHHEHLPDGTRIPDMLPKVTSLQPPCLLIGDVVQPAPVILDPLTSCPTAPLATPVYKLVLEGYNLHHPHTSFAARFYGSYLTVDVEHVMEPGARDSASLADHVISRDHSKALGWPEVAQEHSSTRLQRVELLLHGITAGGLVQLECWFGQLLTCRKQVAVFLDAGMSCELTQHFVHDSSSDSGKVHVSAPAMGTCSPDSATGSPANVLNSMPVGSMLDTKPDARKVDDLMTDMGCWLEFISAMRALFPEAGHVPWAVLLDAAVQPSPVTDAATGITPSKLSHSSGNSMLLNPFKLSSPLLRACMSSGYRRQMLDVALQLLSYSCRSGWVMTAGAMMDDLISLGVGFPEIKHQTSGSNCLLTSAIRSRNPAMVELVQHWAAVHGEKWAWDVQAAAKAACAPASQQLLSRLFKLEPEQLSGLCWSGQDMQTPERRCSTSLGEHILREQEAAYQYWHGNGRSSLAMDAAHNSSQRKHQPDQPLHARPASRVGSDAFLPPWLKPFTKSLTSGSPVIKTAVDDDDDGDGHHEFLEHQQLQQQRRRQLFVECSSAHRASSCQMLDRDRDWCESMGLQPQGLDEVWPSQDVLPARQGEGLGDEPQWLLSGVPSPGTARVQGRLPGRRDFQPSPVVSEEFIHDLYPDSQPDPIRLGTATEQPTPFDHLVSAIQQRGLYLSDPLSGSGSQSKKLAQARPPRDTSHVWGAQSHRQSMSPGSDNLWPALPYVDADMMELRAVSTTDSNAASCAGTSLSTLSLCEHLDTASKLGGLWTAADVLTQAAAPPAEAAASSSVPPASNNIKRMAQLATLLAPTGLLRVSLLQFPTNRLENGYVLWLSRRRAHVRALLPAVMLTLILVMCSYEAVSSQLRTQGLVAYVMLSIPWLIMYSSDTKVGKRCATVQPASLLQAAVTDEHIWIAVMLWQLLVRSLQASNMLCLPELAVSMMQTGWDGLLDGAPQAFVQVRTQPMALVRLLYLLSSAALYMRISSVSLHHALLLAARWNCICLLGAWLLDITNRKVFLMQLVHAQSQSPTRAADSSSTTNTNLYSNNTGMCSANRITQYGTINLHITQATTRKRVASAPHSARA